MQGFLQYTIEPSLIPPSAPISLDTAFFKVFAPDVFKRYPGMPMSVLVNVTSVPTLSFSGGKISTAATAAFSFAVLKRLIFP